MRKLALVAAIMLSACSVQNSENSNEASGPVLLAEKELNRSATTPLNGSIVETLASNPFHSQLASMSLEARNTMLAKFMSASGEICPAVERSFYNGATEDGQAFWSVDCGATDWLVMIEPDSSTQLLECGVSRAVGANSCWTRF